jgi:hypothetical protein
MLSACSEETMQSASAPVESAARAGSVPPALAAESHADLVARRAFLEKAGDLPPLARAQPAKPRAVEARQEPAQALPPGPPPVPFAYVGKLVEGGQRYAVLARDQSVLVARAGETIGGRYRVQSIMEDQLLLMNLDFGVVQALAFSSPRAPGVGILGQTVPKGAGEDASLQLAGPNQVALGEQFTLTVSLDSGANAALDNGSVEVRFDPKVLQLRGSEAEGAVNGSARVEISGAYMGHPAPATMQFRVVAPSPTATEIRVVPTNITDSDGRNVGINAPLAHRLAIVPKSP